MAKTAILFAGQGSQFLNMGLDFLEKNNELASLLKKAEAILGYDILEVLNSQSIHETKYTQPLIFLASALAFEAFKTLDVSYEAITGFSLGEYTAFYAAGIFTFEETLSLIAKRSMLMNDVSTKVHGGMRAVIGLDAAKVLSVCQDLSDKDIIAVANYNEPNQTVITGEQQKLELASEKLYALGARRVLPLKVSGPFHSKYMASVGEQLNTYIKNMKPQKPLKTVYLNTTAQPMAENDDIGLICQMQVQSSVMFYQTINHLVEAGFTQFIEIGPGQVLSGLVRKINPEVKVLNVSTYNDYINLKEQIK